MAKVEFIGITLTRKGRFIAGQSSDFPEKEAKELQRLSTVKNPKPTVKKKDEKPAKSEAKKASKDEK